MASLVILFYDNDFEQTQEMTPNEKGLGFVGELAFRLPITEAQ